jgi:chorismate dehydratase
MVGSEKIQVGAVNYLNTKPLIYGFEKLAPAARLVLDLPSRLADMLRDGRLDVALIPSIEYPNDPAYRIVSDACIACRGPVLSVKLFSRVPAAQIETLALDEGSRTSGALARILLAERYGIHPRLERLPIGAGMADSTADAVILIGDRAIHSPPCPMAAVWDLGDEWCRWTGLPFVFAMWVARPEVDALEIAAALGRARDAGLENLEEIAAIEGPRLGLSRPECLGYLRDNLHFVLGEEELRGLELFYRKAADLGLVPAGVELGIQHCKSA